MAAHRAVFLVLLVLVVASGKPIKLVVSDCGAINRAFRLLQSQFENATTPAPLSMTLTLNCTADWSDCPAGSRFEPSVPAKSTKQPKVTISINTNCKKGQNVTMGKPRAPAFMVVATQAVGASAAVSLTGPIVFTSSVISQVATPYTKSTLKVKDVSTNSVRLIMEAYDLETLSVTGGTFVNSAGIKAYQITKSVTISKVTFDGYDSEAILLELPANTKVMATSNTFKNAASPSSKAISVTQANGKMDINLAKTTTDNSSSVPICITSPANITKPVVSVAGSVGITPTKTNQTLTPAGWPVSDDCSIAEFSAA